MSLSTTTQARDAAAPEPTSPSDAARRRHNTYYYNGGYSDGFPSSSARKRYNAWAYNHPGHYYEVDSNAFPVGSQGWWALKKLEEGGHRGR